MAKTVLIDEIHLTFRVLNNLPDNEAQAIRDTLASDVFMTQLRKAIREVIRKFPELNTVRVSLAH